MESIVRSVVERQGHGPYLCWRIPAVIVTSLGTILVAYECRISDDDWDTRAVAFRRSTDGGHTWNERVFIEKNAALPVNNPVLISARDGTIYFFYQLDMNRLFLRISRDDGVSFSQAKELTYALELFRPEFDWTVCCVGPGHGIELLNGRLVIPLWLSAEPDRKHHPSVSGVILSDDQGESFSRGDIIFGTAQMPSPNETTAAELPGGAVMLNLRHRGLARRRAVTVSADGQSRFQPVWLDQSLPDPACFGSLLSVGDSLLFSNCASESERKHLTVRLSENFGKSWPYAVLIDEEAGYSDLSVSTDGQTVYCFYERGDFRNAPLSLDFVTFSIEEFKLHPV